MNATDTQTEQQVAPAGTPEEQEAVAKSLHEQLLEGINYHARDDGSVITIKDGAGKTCAEVVIGKTATRLNFRSPVPEDIETDLTLEGRSQSWKGGGVRLTPENLEKARSMLLAVVQLTQPAPAAETPAAEAPTAEGEGEVPADADEEVEEGSRRPAASAGRRRSSERSDVEQNA